MPEEKPVRKMIVTVVRDCGDCPNLQPRQRGWRCSKLNKEFNFSTYEEFTVEIKKIPSECPLLDYEH